MSCQLTIAIYLSNRKYILDTLWISIERRTLSRVYCTVCTLVGQIQCTKILLVPSKFDLIMLITNYLVLQYCYSNIELFLIAPCNVIAINLLCLIFCLISLLVSFFSLPTFTIAIVDALLTLKVDSGNFSVTILLSPSRAKETNNFMGSKREKNNEPIYKTDTKVIQSDLFCYRKDGGFIV